MEGKLPGKTIVRWHPCSLGPGNPCRDDEQTNTLIGQLSLHGPVSRSSMLHHSAAGQFAAIASASSRSTFLR